MGAPEQEPARRRKLAWLVAIRVVVSTLLLGSAILMEIRSPGALPVDPFFFLIVLTYIVTITYSLTLRYAEQHTWLVDLQLAGDALIVSAFIYFTGGVGSYFSSLYALPIVAASVLRLRRGAVMVAVLSASLYGGMVLMQYLEASEVLGTGWFASTTAMLPAPRVAQYTVAINVFGFLAVAGLAGWLAESLHRADVRLERASDEIASLQALSEHVINSLQSGLVTTDYDRRVLTWNRAAEAITGIPATAAIGIDVPALLQLPSEFADILERKPEEAVGCRIDFLFSKAGGRKIEIGLSAAHLMTPSGRAGFILNFQDVTELKRVEREARLQQRLAAVGEMAAGIAHEIRNPLASISGSVQLLRHELPLTEEQEQLLDIVLRESDRLNQTITSFLAYAKPQRSDLRPVNLRRVIEDTAALLRNSAEVRREHSIELNGPMEAVWIEADEAQLRQIVWNLAVNGLRAMSGGGRLRLSAANSGTGDVVVSVQDEGIGMAPSDLDNLFQPFRSGFSKGTGLGLAIVHRIVTDYNGEVEVTSQPGAGTTVTVRLPASAPVGAGREKSFT
jgi:two-component system, NtrC family, sensor histidine kinase PilS